MICCKRLQAVEARHVLIEGNDIDAALLQPLQSSLAARGMNDMEALPREAAFDQPRQRIIVVNVQQCRHGGDHVMACGTWMTEKNRPSWRMALAKFS